MRKIHRKEPSNSCDLSYLSKNVTNSLKGILSVCIVMHHVALDTELFGRIGKILMNPVGSFSVAIFFFLSGYGLLSSYYQKGMIYIDRFPRNRILPFYLICVLLTFISIVINEITQYEELSTKLVIWSLTFGKNTIIRKGWYLQVALLSYLCFYLIFHSVRNNKCRLVLALVVEIAFVGYCILNDYPETYYKSTPAILVGGLWCVYRKELDAFLTIRKMILVMTLFVALCFASVLVGGISAICLKLVLAILVGPMALFCIKKISINNLVTRWLGTYSFEIYICHGIVMNVARGASWYIVSDCCFLIMTVVGTGILSVLLKPLTQKIYTLIRI